MINFRQYLKENHIKISELARKSDVPYSTLNDIANGRVDIDRVQTGITVRIAAACGISFEELYDLLTVSSKPPVLEKGKIFIRNKQYYLEYGAGGKKEIVYLYRVTPENTEFVKTAAEWAILDIEAELENQKQDEEMRRWMENITT